MVSEMPCKIRKRRFLTALSSRNEKCFGELDRILCEEDEHATVTLPKSETDDRLVEVLEKSSTNVDRFRNTSRSSPGLVSATEVTNPQYRPSCNFMEKNNSFGEMPLTYNTKQSEGKSRSYGEKTTNGLDEIKHSLTLSKQILKLLVHVWTADPNHGHHHPTSISLTSTLNHELKKARSHVNKLIQEQRSNQKSGHKAEEQDKIRLAVKTISQELETERKLRRQAERMNKKLGRELANTKSLLAKAIQEVESEKQASEVLDRLCQKMVHSIEEHRVELEELKKESERVLVEIEEEREMLRVADMLREERVYMKLIDAKHEYEDKHKQVDTLARDVEELLEADNGIYHITPRVLSWYQSTVYNKNKSKNNTGKMGKVVNNDENTLEEEVRNLSWLENKGEVVNDDMTNTNNEVVGRNSDCIELEFGLDMKHENEELNDCLGFSGLSTMKEYEDEMERYKMIKDLRDRIVSASDLS